MYSVLRVTDSNLRLELVERFGLMINSIIENKYKGLRQAKDGFSIEISDNQSSEIHFKEMIFLIQKLNKIIIEMIEKGIQLTFDVAIEPEDKNCIYGNVLHMTPELMLLLGKNGISMEISEYKSN